MAPTKKRPARIPRATSEFKTHSRRVELQPFWHRAIFLRRAAPTLTSHHDSSFAAATEGERELRAKECVCVWLWCALH